MVKLTLRWEEEDKITQVEATDKIGFNITELEDILQKFVASVGYSYITTVRLDYESEG